MPWALRSVMPRLAAMPSRRTRVVCEAQQHPGVVGQEGLFAINIVTKFWK